MNDGDNQMADLRNLKCVECEQTEEDMLVFVGTLRYEDGTVEDLQEGMHPYCTPCREKLNISDELNAGRDLRAEAKQMVLDAVAASEAVTDKENEGINIIYKEIDRWIGGTDKLFAMMGRPAPERPQEVFDGVSDAYGELDPSKLSVIRSLALITASNTVKDRIPNWEDFVQRTYQHFKATMGEEKARGNLVGFI
jgi:hypothetical protein